MGAASGDIIKMFALEFLKLIIIANIIAVIPTFFIFKYWLKSFAYQTNIPLWIFLLSALVSVFFAVIMISYQTIKAALATPVKSLRYE